VLSWDGAAVESGFGRGDDLPAPRITRRVNPRDSTDAHLNTAGGTDSEAFYKLGHQSSSCVLKPSRGPTLPAVECSLR
jgi:hypothetical protein